MERVFVYHDMMDEVFSWCRVLVLRMTTMNHRVFCRYVYQRLSDVDRGASPAKVEAGIDSWLSWRSTPAGAGEKK